MLGWLSEASTCASRRKRAIRSPSSANASGRIFSATSRLSFVSRARYTSPIPPAPSRALTSYGPRLVPRVNATGSGWNYRLFPDSDYSPAGDFTTRSDLEDFAEEREIGEHRADVAGRVQIVDQRRSDRRLRQHQLNGRLRGAGVDVDHADERAVGTARFEREPLVAQGYDVSEAGQRRVALGEEVVDLAAGRVALIARKPLRRIREHACPIGRKLASVERFESDD